MNLAFRNLEQKMLEELREIKEQLMKLTAMLAQPSGTSKLLTPATPATPSTPSTPFMPTTPSMSAPFLKPTNMKIIKFEQITLKPSQEKKLPQLKQMESAPEREEEIDRFNNTMLADQDFQLFTYYWKLENITEHIADASTRTVKSPMFSIRGEYL